MRQTAEAGVDGIADGARGGAAGPTVTTAGSTNKNPDPLDEWTEKCLGGLKREEMVDFIFDGLYDDRFKAYDIFNDKLIPARTIKKMEEDGEFTRDQVSKIQFVEDWYVDPGSYAWSKRVTEVRLGLEHVDGFGMHMGHNPLFKVRLVE